jgi:hypothetical protein
MPVRRGHVAPKTTLIETIIRKFDTHSEYTKSNRNFLKWGKGFLCQKLLDCYIGSYLIPKRVTVALKRFIKNKQSFGVKISGK